MKNISKKVLALVATTMLSYGAVAQDGYYVKGEVGVSMPQEVEKQKLEKSAIFGIEGGYKVNDNFRFGLGVNFANNMKFKGDGSLKGAKVKSLIFEANTYYDIADFNGFTPYITAGVGVAKNSLKGTSTASSTKSANNVNILGGRPGTQLVGDKNHGKSCNSKKTGLAWNIGLGGMYNINSDIAIDVTYRYRDLGKVKLSETVSKKLRSNNFTFGTVFKF